MKVLLNLLNVSLISLSLVASAEDVPSQILEAEYQYSISDTKEYLRQEYAILKDSVPDTQPAKVICFSDGRWEVYPTETYYRYTYLLTQHGRNILHDSVVREGIRLCKAARILIQEKLYEY